MAWTSRAIEYPVENPKRRADSVEAFGFPAIPEPEDDPGGANARMGGESGLPPVISVRDFGAMSDGTTDDTAAVVEAYSHPGRCRSKR